MRPRLRHRTVVGAQVLGVEQKTLQARTIARLSPRSKRQGR